LQSSNDSVQKKNVCVKSYFNLQVLIILKLSQI